MQREVPFTTRTVVKVRLAPAGHKLLEEYIASRIYEIRQTEVPGRAAIDAAKIQVEFEPNLRGLHVFQMWEFLRIFGGHNMPNRETTDTALFHSAVLTTTE